MRIMINMLSKNYLVLCLLLLALTGYAQVPTFTLTLANQASTSNTLEFDLMLTVPSSPPAGVRLTGINAGVEFNTAILNGGAPCTTLNCGSFILIPGTAASQFTGMSAVNTTYRATPAGHLRIVQGANQNSTADLVPGTYRVGRYRLTIVLLQLQLVA
ncbi:MAG: hypothetical protein IPP30_03280 [Flavobacterium sp.]|nr:hypothetical protein [Flavobacterium sp.]